MRLLHQRDRTRPPSPLEAGGRIDSYCDLARVAARDRMGCNEPNETMSFFRLGERAPDYLRTRATVAASKIPQSAIQRCQLIPGRHVVSG